MSDIDIPGMVIFLRERAIVERQQGTNQLMCGSESGKWRIDRANKFDECADGYAILQCSVVNLQSEISNLKLEIAKLKK